MITVSRSSSTSLHDAGALDSRAGLTPCVGPREERCSTESTQPNQAVGGDASEALMERSRRYVPYFETAYAVAARFVGDTPEAECLVEEALTTALQAELEGEHVIWVKSHLLKHVRHAYLRTSTPKPRRETA